MRSLNHLEIPLLLNGNQIILSIYPQTKLNKDTLFEEESPIIGQEKWQLIEGCTYTYEFTNNGNKQFQFANEDEIIKFHHSDKHPCEGFINTGIYVGHLSLNIVDIATKERCGKIGFEVRSVKADYEHDYRQMLEDIAEVYTDLVLHQSAPVTQRLEIDENTSSESLYQRFAFIKSIIESDSFSEAIHKILSNPIKKWTDARYSKNIMSIKRLSRKNINQFASSSDRILLPSNSNIGEGLNSIPRRIEIEYKKDTIDVPENQFIKFALTSFRSYCEDLLRHPQARMRLKEEARSVIETLSGFLDMQFFRGISSPSVFNMNSPVLQRKEGYREVFQVWLLFDLAAKLNWSGGENVYEAGKKNIATLYEYWLFFKLVELISGFFEINPKDKSALVNLNNDTIDLDLKQGRMKVIHGQQMTSSRMLNIAFYYNRTFSKPETITKAGSWSMSMRPDYTLSIWPGSNIKEEEAEAKDLITHIHFDAKYRLNKIILEDTSGEDLNIEKKEQEIGIYKRADLLKMHAYKDAIRRTSGAYILYPGTENKQIKGYHEIIPGLGAFCVRPGHWSEDSKELNQFITDIRDHFLNRCNIQEKMSYHRYSLLNSENKNLEFNRRTPEYFNDNNRGLFPDTIKILIDYSNDENVLNWIMSEHKYSIMINNNLSKNARLEDFVKANYILIYDKDKTTKLLRISNRGKGPIILNQDQLIEEKYPKSVFQGDNQKNSDLYLLYKLEKDIEPELYFYNWNITHLLSEDEMFAKPKVVSLIDLINDSDILKMKI